MEVLIAIIAVLGGLIVGAISGYVGRQVISGRRGEAARREASRILEDAAEEKRAILLGAKEESLGTRSAVEADLRERRSELQRTERRLSNREENSERRATNVERRERSLAQQEQAVQQAQDELVELKQKELEQLEAISNLSAFS